MTLEQRSNKGPTDDERYQAWSELANFYASKGDRESAEHVVEFILHHWPHKILNGKQKPKTEAADKPSNQP